MSITKTLSGVSDAELVAAVSGRSIRVRQMFGQQASTETAFILKSGGTGGTSIVRIGGTYNNAGDDAHIFNVTQPDENGLCTCESGENLYIETAGTGAVTGTLIYDLI